MVEKVLVAIDPGGTIPVEMLPNMEGGGPHTHPISDVTNLQTSLDGKAASAHSHAISDVTNLQTSLDGKASTTHSHAIGDVTNLQSSLDGKAASSHTHAQSEVTNLVTDLAGKAASSHTHAAGDLPNLSGITAPSGSVNFNGQQATSFRIENRTSDPVSPTVGQIWLRTDL